MHIRVFLAGFFSFCVGTNLQAGFWKASLDFHVNGHPVKHINSFHLGLHDLERESTQSPLSSSEMVDNIGNRFCSRTDSSDGASVIVDAAKNTSNVALASIQIIYREAEAEPLKFHFVHLYKMAHDRTTANRLFRSGGSGGMSADSMRHLLGKCGSVGVGAPSRPSKLDLLDRYHPFVHAEDKIFYLLNKHHKNMIRTAWESIHSPRGSIIDSIIFHMHTRLDMCGNCSYALDWELRESGGFGPQIIDYVSRHLNQDYRRPVKFGALVSSRQDYLVWGSPRRTLPESPPLSVGETTAELFQFYRQTIDVNMLSAQRQFAQAVVPLFQVRPIDPTSSYQLAWNNNGGSFPIIIPTTTISTAVTPPPQ